MRLRQRLETVRIELGGLSQKQASERFGLGENTWATYERADKLPKDDVLLELARLGFSLDWLATGQGEMRRGARPSEAGTDPADVMLPDLLENVIVGVEMFLEERRWTSDPARKARLVSSIYRIMARRRAAAAAAGRPFAAETPGLPLDIHADPDLYDVARAAS